MAGFATCSVVHADPIDQDVFTDFESIETAIGEPFSVGTAPVTAQFSGDAFSGFAGVLELYHSGIRAWMVTPSGTGMIEFATHAAQVEFFGRTRSTANGPTVIRALDGLGNEIDSVTLTPPNPFQLIAFTGNIARLEVVNQATGTGQMDSVDDFGFTPLPFGTVGDLDVDSDIDFDDIDEFVLNLNAPAQYLALFGSGSELQGDTDGDGDVDFDDIDEFVGLLTAADGRSLGVPEPSAWLLALAWPLWLMLRGSDGGGPSLAVRIAGQLQRAVVL
jgi:hypothetical protein